MPRTAVLLILMVCGWFPAPLMAEDIPAARIYRDHSDSVVLIGAVHQRKRENKSGSGFVVSRDGLIVTNYHLVQGAKRILVKTRDGNVYTKTRVIKADPARDLAVLKIDGQSLTPLTLADSSLVDVGERVMTIGHPLGLENSVSDGLVSSVREGEYGIKLLQISVPLSRGSSGGPVFNREGEVVGVAVASLKDGQSLNFAIPSNEVQRVLDRTRDEGEDELPSRKERTEEDFVFYRVCPDDTLFALARRFDTSVPRIIRANRLSGETIYVGQKLKIPR